MSTSISVCLIVKNEAQLIGNCLRSIRGIAGEMVVVDTGSRDGTAEIAHSLGARVIRHRWDGNYAHARNVYLEAARGRWILALDGDESIARRDLPTIERLVRRRSFNGYELTVRNYTDTYDLMWKWSANDGTYRKEERFSRCAGSMRTKVLRLFRKLPGLHYETVSDSAHTSALPSLKQHAGRIETREDVIIHHFQCLKGDGRFLASKQRRRLQAELDLVRRRPRETYPYLNAARTLFAQQRDDEAVRYLSRALRVDPHFHDAHQLLGMIHLENGRLTAAERHLVRATEIDPRSADAWALLGMVYVEASRQAEARAAFHQAIELHPGHLLAHNSLGVLHEDEGSLRQAERQYRTALRLHPRFRPALGNLARVQRARDRRA
jgi:glycosyltransferase involved in cell wall biosynthesis